MKIRTLICSAEEVLNLLKNESATLWRVEKKQPVLVPSEFHAGTWEWPYASRKLEPGEILVKTNRLLIQNGNYLLSKASWAAEYPKGQPLDPTPCMACFCPYGQIGDRLLVKEVLHQPQVEWRYRADNQLVMVDVKHKLDMLAWAHHKNSDQCPAGRMPPWASRLLLELIGIQFVQRPVQGNFVWGWVLTIKRVEQ